MKKLQRPLAGSGPEPQQQVQQTEQQAAPDPPAPREPQEDADTLFSSSYARIVEAISEGEIEGLVDRAGNVLLTQAEFGKGIFIDDTSLMTDDGRRSVQGIKVGMTWGTSDQFALNGFGKAAETITSGAALKFGTPVTLSITNPDADIFELAVRFDAMLTQDDTTGDIHGSSVGYVVQVSLNGGAFTVLQVVTVTGKCRSPYLKTTANKLPRSSDPANDAWVVRVVRTTVEAASSKVANSSFVDFITVYARNEFRYPYTALVAAEISARGFTSIPSRSYRIKGIRVLVPSNYFPETREYNRNVLTGDPVVDDADAAVPQAWDGNFYRAWTNNPAWIMFDLLTNTRYGVGKQMSVTPQRPFGNVDKWSMYPIAQYCDELVEDGFGGLEPRFQASIYIQAQESAWKVVQDFASIFRGMPFWERGAVTFSQDRPKTIQRIFTNANVVDGIFNYSGSAKKARHTVAIVRYSDEDNRNKPAFEYVPDPEGVAKYGVRETQVAAFATTSRSQAHRVGRYILKSELQETGLVTFQTGLEGMTLRPGTLFGVLDNDRAGVTQGGRILAVAGNRLSVTLDRPIAVPAGVVTVLMGAPAAFLGIGEVTDSSAIPAMAVPQLVEVTTTTAATSSTATLAFAAAINAEVVPGAVWVVKTQALVPQTFRCMSIEESKGMFTVTGLEYSPGKFSDIDDNLIIDSGGYTGLPDNPLDVPPVKNLTLSRRAVITPEGVTLKIDATWEMQDFALTEFFLIEKRFGTDANDTTANYEVVEQTRATTSSFNYTVVGAYSVRVTTISTNGVRSVATVATIVIPTTSPIELYSITGLELQGQGNDTNFTGRDAIFDWRLNSPAAGVEIGLGVDDTRQDPYFRYYVVSFWDVVTNHKLAETLATTPTMTFDYAWNVQTGGPRTQFRIEVRGQSKYGEVTAPATLVVQNPPPNPPTDLTITNAWTVAQLAWHNAADNDLQGVDVYQSSDSDFSHAVLVTTVPAPQEVFTITQLVPNTNYWFWIRARDAFGSASALVPPAGQQILTSTIASTDIGDFSIAATKEFRSVVVVDGAIWKNHDPTEGAISWNAHRVVFNGAKYEIPAGSTTDQFVWWRGPVYGGTDGVTLISAGETAYRTYLTNPKDDGTAGNVNDFIIATNAEGQGVYDLAWRGMANAVIGSAFIGRAAIKAANIESLTADQLTSGTIDGQVIRVGGVDGELKSTNYVAGVQGWRLGGDGTAEVGSLSIRENLALGSAYYNAAFGETKLFQARPDITLPIVKMNHIWTATAATSTSTGANKQTLVCKDGVTRYRYMLMNYGQLTTGGTSTHAYQLFSEDQAVPSPEVAPLFFGVGMSDFLMDYTVPEADFLTWLARPRRLGVDGDNIFTLELVCRAWDCLSVWYQIADTPVLDPAVDDSEILSTSGRWSMGNVVGKGGAGVIKNQGHPWIFAAEQQDSSATNSYGTLTLVKRVKINVPADKCILFGYAPVNGLGGRVTNANSWFTHNGYFRVTAENVGNILITDDPGQSTVVEDV